MDKEKSATFSIRLPGTMRDVETVEASKVRGWTRSKYIAVATGEKLVRDGYMEPVEFRRQFGFDPEGCDD